MPRWRVFFIFPLRPRPSNNGLPICGDEVHGLLGLVFWAFLLPKRKSSDDDEFVLCSIWLGVMK